ncbi:MAG: nuclease-related domain-containing protein [Candidatus Enterosoma sp.]|nr:nuclease-related domain-containing protein [bacterium]MDY5866160.1 nuclease-related domain-containing protein [Candidatus Enterosoma sp.]
MPKAAVITLIILISLLLLSALFFFEFKRLYEKKKFKKIVYKKLFNFANEADQLLLNDVHLSFSYGNIEIIDHIFIADKYIYLIKDVYYPGILIGNISDPYFFQIGKKEEKKKVRNPLLDNQHTVEELALALNFKREENIFVNVVCYNSSLVLPDELKVKKQGVFFVPACELVSTIKEAEKDNIPVIPHQKSEKLINFLAEKSKRVKENEKVRNEKRK